MKQFHIKDRDAQKAECCKLEEITKRRMTGGGLGILRVLSDLQHAFFSNTIN